MVQYALFIRKPWCEKIFNEGKSWELRSYPLPANKKGEIVAVACSKANVLLGEIRLSGCLRVGSKRGGVWQPASNSEKHVKKFFWTRRIQRRSALTRTVCPMWSTGTRTDVRMDDQGHQEVRQTKSVETDPWSCNFLQDQTWARRARG